MKCFIGIGSNIGNRRENLEKAANALNGLSLEKGFRISPLYETSAIVPEGAPSEWKQSFLNAVAEIEWPASAQELLHRLKGIEKELGRVDAPRWSPRTIDLDLLLFGAEVIEEHSLCVPHPGILNRSFVLDPLKDLVPQRSIPRSKNSFVIQARKLKTHSPWIMGIINLTPDSFSDGGETQTLVSIENKILRMEEAGVHAIDIGAESTRPGAMEITLQEERLRLEPVLDLLKSRYYGKLIRPFISVDTRRPEIAEFAIEYDVDCINDVGGLSNTRMLDVLKTCSCDYVLMHSLCVPADSRVTFSMDRDPVLELKNWLHSKLDLIESEGIDLSRIIFDPGIGFGKTPQQSISILNRMNEFADIPIRLLVGHSRKSFMTAFGATGTKDRDAATLAISLDLANTGVDILRVHDFKSHLSAFKTRAEVLQ
jgi:2-amino-4-hydroxy-6-hydroxymethyldihydropteridine diphosphokinase/dihydropteroate synthase